MLHRTLDVLLGLFFPDRCAGCGRLGAQLCAACRAALRPYPGGDRPSPQLDATAVAYLFGAALRPAIHQLKYRGNRRMARVLGDLLAAHLRANPLPADALLPVPLHTARLAERGFNQSELLARRLAQACRLPLLAGGLARVRATAQQARLDARARQENMREAFSWSGAAPPPARLLLVDDVFTTGATLSACAAALRAAGAREVRAIALARSRPDLDRT
jgi:ComF family protein